VIEDEETPGSEFTALHIKYLSGYPDGSVKPDNRITRAELCAMLYRLLDGGGKDISPETGFPDVAKSAWYYKPVAYLAHIGVITGYPDGTFGPDRPMTRAEFVTIIAKFFELEPTAESKFPDIAGHWASSYIIAVENKGWINGYPDGTFGPGKHLTRAEAVSMINRMLERGIAVSDLPDWVTVYKDLETTHWAYAELMEAANEHRYYRKENGMEIWTPELPD
jgi:hypothetical protein